MPVDYSGGKSHQNGFKKGDEVYADIQDFTVGNPKQVGTLAEFTVAEEHLLALKPSNLSFEEATSLPLALLTALQAFDTVDFQKGQIVFIVGGAGNVGTLAIQLAKHVFEASRIVSTSSAGKAEFVKSLGADLVVDYTKKSYDIKTLQRPPLSDFCCVNLKNVFAMCNDFSSLLGRGQCKRSQRVNVVAVSTAASKLSAISESPDIQVRGGNLLFILPMIWGCRCILCLCSCFHTLHLNSRKPSLFAIIPLLVAVCYSFVVCYWL